MSLASRARYDLGLEYEGQKQYEKAVQQYLKVAELQPEHTPTYTKLGNLYTALGRYDDAAVSLGEAARRDSSRAEVWCSLATAQRQGGHLDQANASIAKAISLDPSSPTCRVEQLNIGSAYQTSGQLEKALAIYRSVLAHNPDFREAHVNLGILYHARKEYSQAIPSFVRAIALSPDRQDYHLGLAQSLEAAGRREEAIEAYRHALSLGPDSPLARGRLESLVGKEAAP
jgi:tetratricopeptide (TPR) repeat protein